MSVTCDKEAGGAFTDFILAADGTVIPRSLCLDAWHDQEYADVVPGYGHRVPTESLQSRLTQCAALAPFSEAERTHVAQEMMNKVALIAEREVRRVSLARGIPPCQAAYVVFKPMAVDGQPIADGNGIVRNNSGPVVGFSPDSFFPVLLRQWTDGPFRLKWAIDCTLHASFWVIQDRWSNNIFKEPNLYPHVDPSQIPAGEVWDARTSTCISYGVGLGNIGVGGAGVVFGSTWDHVSMPNDVRDCLPRALHQGMYASVTDTILPPDSDLAPRPTTTVVSSPPVPRKAGACTTAGTVYQRGATNLICARKSGRLVWREANMAEMQKGFDVLGVGGGTSTPTPVPAKPVTLPIKPTAKCVTGRLVLMRLNAYRCKNFGGTKKWVIDAHYARSDDPRAPTTLCLPNTSTANEYGQWSCQKWGKPWHWVLQTDTPMLASGDASAGAS